MVNQAHLRVGVLLQERFTLNAFAGFVDCLRLAGDKGGRSRQVDCSWRIMGEGSVIASCGMHVEPDTDLCAPENFDYIAVCGGNSYLDAGSGKDFLPYLQSAAASGVRLIGICTGSFLLARAGLMDGYRACVHWNVYDDFHKEFPHIQAVADRLFLDSGNRVTCAGSSGATDLALHLVRRHCGPEKAAQAVRHMMLQEARPANHPQAHFYTELASVRDSRVRRAVHFMEQSLNEHLSTAQVADHVNLSPRQFERVFYTAMGQSPLAYFRNMRLRYALWLLQHTEASMADVAAEVGFADGSHFARSFRSLYGTSPHQVRQAIPDVNRQLRPE